METQTNAQDLKKKITNYLEELARETDVARKSEAMQKYLEFVSRFHRYSANNIWLILMAKPEATLVAGFQAWKKMNRWVKKGEKGIAIFAPLLCKEEPDNDKSPKMLGGFRIVYVFDLSQTEGDPLPATPDWKSPEKNAELTERLVRFAESKGIKVTFKDLPGEIQGVSKGKEIEIDPSAGSKTLVHEIAHELMHREEGIINRHEIKELQAEAVAYVVSSYFRIHDLKSSNYTALLGGHAGDIRSNLERIANTATEIINSIVN